MNRRSFTRSPTHFLHELVGRRELLSGLSAPRCHGPGSSSPPLKEGEPPPPYSSMTIDRYGTAVGGDRDFLWLRDRIFVGSGQGRAKVGPRSGQGRAKVGPRSGQGRAKVGPRPGQGRAKAGPRSGQGRPNGLIGDGIGRKLVRGFACFARPAAQGRPAVGGFSNTKAQGSKAGHTRRPDRS